MADDQPLPRTEQALAAVRRDLTAHTRALGRALKHEARLTDGARQAHGRALRLLRRSRTETDMRARVTVVMATESVQELALLALPAPAVRPVPVPVTVPLRAGASCRPL
ncbi:hypothetical protein [Streptomyces sp. NPDC001889]